MKSTVMEPKSDCKTKIALAVNDAVWIFTAIAYMVVDEPGLFLQSLVWITTVVYAADIVAKLKAMEWRLGMFMRRYWLDVLFLIPFVKFFRGMRMFRAGRTMFYIVRCFDTANDISEIAFRAFRGMRRLFGSRSRSA